MSVPEFCCFAVRKFIKSLFIKTVSCSKSPAGSPGPSRGHVEDHGPGTNDLPRVLAGDSGSCFGVRWVQGSAFEASGTWVGTVAWLEAWSMKLPPCWWLPPCCPWGAPQLSLTLLGRSGGAGRKGVWFQKDCRVTRLLGHSRRGKNPGLSSPDENWPLVFFNKTPRDLRIK